MLWHEEKYRIFTKGLSARLAQSGVFSTAIILGYESIKRFSINDDYRDVVRW
jgi:solute carrier family 25 protein 44